MNKNIIYKKHMEDKMQDKGLDFKHKEVVNISNGKRLGYVRDNGNDFAIVYEGTAAGIAYKGFEALEQKGYKGKLINIFSQNNDIVIPWKNIKCIGDDLILVEI